MPPSTSAAAPLQPGVLSAVVEARPWVLVAGAFLKTGGQDRANYALASYLAGRGAPVHLVAHAVADDLDQRTLCCHIATRPLRSDLLGEPFLRTLGQRTARSLAASAPHVVANGGNCASPDINWVHYVHAAFDRPLVGSWSTRMRMRLSHRRWLAAERAALTGARLVIANSERTRADLIDKVGIAADKIRVVYYGIDAELFRPASEDERLETRRHLGWPGDRPVALFIGALGDTRKGFDTVFRAWETLRREKAVVPLLVTIGSGAMLTTWQRRVDAAGLSGDITFLGFRSDVPQLVRAADLLVAPTRYEAYGLGVHEALCCGLPAIVSAGAGVAERYPPELQTLLIGDPESPEELACRVRETLSGTARAGAALADLSARLRARTWNDMAAEIVAAVGNG